MNLRPLNDRLIVKPLPKEEVTKSGIIIPETADNSNPLQGKVLAVGPGAIKDGQRIAMDVKPGDTVMYKGGYGSDKVKIDGEEYLILSEYEIIAIVEN
ncbi:MAG: co-chaperone GroES [Patescibacteria group bacterium]|nr:co-chaperone GroES [Patescibacteria group bacterium]